MRPRIRAGRGTNIAILSLLVGAIATGIVAIAVGTSWSRWVVLAHGVAGISLVVIAPWKAIISRRGIRRRGPRSVPSVALAALVVVALVGGIAHAAGVGDLGVVPVRALWLHVAAALAALPLAAWHVVARRTYPRRSDVSRRAFVRGGLVLAGGAATYAILEGAIGGLGLPGARRRFTGSHEVGSFAPIEMPTTTWLNDRAPSIHAASYQVMVATTGGRREWSVADLAAFGDRLRATLDCTSGWYATQDWSGVRLDRLVGGAGGRSVVVRSTTGYARRFPLRDAPGMILATHVGGARLDRGHGAPVRLVAPGRRGFWWVKWVVEVRVDDVPWWWQPPLPLA